jgi:hypothetical protein
VDIPFGTSSSLELDDGATGKSEDEA